MIMRVLLQNYVLSGIHRPWIRLATLICASECQYKKVVMAAICLCSPPTVQYLYSFWLLQSGERESCNMFILLVLNEPSLPAPPGLQLQRLANKCMRSDLIRYKPVPVLLASKISFLPPTKTDQSRNSVYSKGKGSKQCADMLACGSFRDAGLILEV